MKGAFPHTKPAPTFALMSLFGRTQQKFILRNSSVKTYDVHMFFDFLQNAVTHFSLFAYRFDLENQVIAL